MTAVDRLFTPQELADYLGIPLSTVYTWAARGMGPDRIRVGRHTRYRMSAVDAWLNSNVKPAQATA